MTANLLTLKSQLFENDFIITGLKPQLAKLLDSGFPTANADRVLY